MNDGIMYTHEVVRYDSHCNTVVHVCAKLETAEYLKDWCDAIDEDRYKRYREVMVKTGLSSAYVDGLAYPISRYVIQEGEVFL